MNLHYDRIFFSIPPSSLIRLGLRHLTGFVSRQGALQGPSNLPLVLLRGLQRFKDTVRCAALGAEVQGHCLEQLTQTLSVHFNGLTDDTAISLTIK